MEYDKEIPFGAFDSELMHQEIFIPEGFEATIDGDKIILTRKESEDERIRKELIEFVKSRGGFKQEYIAWLEKQVSPDIVADAYLRGCNDTEKKLLEKYREQKLPIEELPMQMKSVGESLGFTTQEECDEYNKMVSELIMSDDKKVKPKFKVGDYVVGKYISGYITEVRDDCYLLDYQGFSIDKQDNYHLWTIQDAKDGDLIYVSTEVKGIQAIFHKFENGIIYFHCNLCRDFTQGGYEPSGDVGFVKPLQKTHYQKFFQKMHDTGYIWNAEKKELKKIEQNNEIVEALRTEYEKGRADAIAQMQKEWSEEDENTIKILMNIIRKSEMIDSIIYTDSLKEKLYDKLESLKDRVQSQPQQEWKQDNKEDLTNFECAMMHIGESFFGHNAGLDPNNTNDIKEQANLLKELAMMHEWSEDDDNHEYFSELLENDNSDNIDDYAYKCAYCISHDWIKDTATWDDVERACKLGAEWNEKHHKPAWSEEDEKILKKVMHILSLDGRISNEELKSIFDWLKSLRPQSKQEWSKEDDDFFNDTIAFLKDTKNALDHVDWIKSLKERCTWKPSDEQLEAFEHFIRSIGESGYSSPYENNTKLLYSLLNNLKKLKT